MITKPTLKPMRGFVEVERDGRRVYKNVKTGVIVEPAAARTADSEPTTDNEILNALLGVTDDEE